MKPFMYGMVCSQCSKRGLTEVMVETATGKDWCYECWDKQYPQDEPSEFEQQTADEKLRNPEN